MNKIYFFVLLLCLFVACDKTTYDLSGKWQVEEIQYADGTVLHTDSIFYNFQSTLFTYQIMNDASFTGSSQYPGYRRMIDDTTMELEFRPTDSEFGGRTPEQSMKVAGWKEPIRIFKIEKLSRKKLILSSEGDTFIFHNF